MLHWVELGSLIHVTNPLQMVAQGKPHVKVSSNATASRVQRLFGETWTHKNRVHFPKPIWASWRGPVAPRSSRAPAPRAGRNHPGSPDDCPGNRSHTDMGQNYTTRNWTAGFSSCFHLPGFHFGVTQFLTYSHTILTKRGHFRGPLVFRQ